MSQLIAFNKPFRVLSQFTTDSDKLTLAQYIPFPNFYPAGRLDYDSEGLLLLTDDGRLQQQISHPRFKMAKQYWVQVEGQINDHAIQCLRQGVTLKDGPTQPTEAACIEPPKTLWERQPPIRERKQIPTSWLALTLKEGRNRQVRRMTAAVGFPTLRLIRAAIGPWTIANLAPGDYRFIDTDEPALAKLIQRSLHSTPKTMKRHRKSDNKTAIGKRNVYKKPPKD